MESLKKKGLLAKRKKKTNFYSLLISRKQVMEYHPKYLIEYLFDDDTDELLEFIFQNMQELKDLLAIMYSTGWHRASKSVH